jgi:Holliday junction resolvase RusA-like endonuclease
MNCVSFTVPGAPRGKGRPRATRMGKGVRLYTDDKTANFENLIRLAYQQEHDIPPASGALEIQVNAYFPIPKSASKKARLEMEAGRVYPTKKPDLDNVLKAVLDGLNGVAFVDDCQIVSIQSAKKYDAIPRLEIKIWHL